MRSTRGAFRGLVLALLATAGPGRGEAAVDLVPVSASSRWPGAVEEGALRLACSGSVEELAGYFRQRGLPFRSDLVRDGRERVCHVLYEPTVPGFRASPDDDAVREVFFDSDPLLFLAGPLGDQDGPGGVMREVLRRVRRPLEVAILVHRGRDGAAYEEAARRSYRDTPHRVRLLERGSERSFWWVQDCLKAGRSDRGETILVPRRLFEGLPGNGEALEPLLGALSRESRVVRSRLSWEGGDLQFTRDPADPRRLVLFYGSFAKAYWGESLTRGEFEYVLSREFGADRAVDLSGLAPHVDYFVSFLPLARAALVGVPRSGDLDVARAAADALLRAYAGREPETLVDLRQGLSSPVPDRARLEGILARARREQGGWDFAGDPALPDRVRALVARACPGGEDCFSEANRGRMIESDPAVFAEWAHAVQRARDEQSVVSAHLDLVASQLEPVPEHVRRLANERIAALEEVGFRVIRVPAFRVNLVAERDWPGISYVNALVVDRQVFVPRFGLGEVEDRILRELARELPEGYSVVPIHAQRALIRNGGLHCLAGIVRSPPGEPVAPAGTPPAGRGEDDFR